MWTRSVTLASGKLLSSLWLFLKIYEADKNVARPQVAPNINSALIRHCFKHFCFNWQQSNEKGSEMSCGNTISPHDSRLCDLNNLNKQIIFLQVFLILSLLLTLWNVLMKMLFVLPTKIHHSFCPRTPICESFQRHENKQLRRGTPFISPTFGIHKFWVRMFPGHRNTYD